MSIPTPEDLEYARRWARSRGKLPECTWIRDRHEKVTYWRWLGPDYAHEPAGLPRCVIDAAENDMQCISHGFEGYRSEEEAWLSLARALKAICEQVAIKT